VVLLDDSEFATALDRARQERDARLEEFRARANAPHKDNSGALLDGVQTLHGILDARGWAVREGQVRMVEHIEDANRNEDGSMRTVGVVAVVAPVGTGKTLGYLAPALARGDRIIIATSTKALQDQIVGEELPRLREDMLNAYGRYITFAVLKGKSNYACLSHVDATIAHYQSEVDRISDSLLEDITLSEDDDLPILREIAQQARLALASGETALFDSSALLGRLSPDTLRNVTAKHSCPARRMDADSTMLDYAEDDSTDVYRAAYAKAMLADVVVLNTALLVEEIKKQNNKVSPTTPSLLEGVGMVIVDEAHHAPAIVAEAFSERLRRKDSITAAKQIDNRLPESKRVFERLAREYFDGIDEADETIRSRREFSEAVARLGNQFHKQALAHIESLRNEAGDKALGLMSDFRDEVTSVAAAIGVLALRTTTRNDREVLSTRVSVDFDESGSDFEISAVPIDVSFFRERLVSAMTMVGPASREPKTPLKTIVLCSGTMNAAVPRLLGLGGSNVLRTVDSPFDPRRARVCVPAHLPTPKEGDRWMNVAWEDAQQAILAAEGRTLFLCTSYNAVREFARRARETLPFTVLQQDNRVSRAETIGRFAEDEHSVLFATMGYWEGIDVPGPSLSLVVIDKIPFPLPNDSIMEARREWVDAEGGDSFHLVDVAYASTMLAQASGRLIRAAEDCGGVLVLDSRLVNARYGSGVTAQMEPRWLLYRDINPFVKWMRAVSQAHACGTPDAVLDYPVDTEPLRPKARMVVR